MTDQPAEDNFKSPPPMQRESVFVMSDANKASSAYMADLRHATWESKTPRRKWAAVVQDTLIEFEGEIFDKNGKEWFAPDVEDVFGTDQTFRWISNFAAPHGEQKPIKAFQMGITDRITLIDLYFRLSFPEKAVLFGLRDASPLVKSHAIPDSPSPQDPMPPGPGHLENPDNGRETRTISFEFAKLGFVKVAVILPANDNERAMLVDQLNAALTQRGKELGLELGQMIVPREIHQSLRALQKHRQGERRPLKTRRAERNPASRNPTELGPGEVPDGIRSTTDTSDQAIILGGEPSRSPSEDGDDT